MKYHIVHVSACHLIINNKKAISLSQNMKFTLLWNLRQAQSQISLRISIRAAWPEPLQVALICYDCMLSY